MPIAFIAFVVVPLIEFLILLQVSEVVGWGWSVLALVLVSLFGAVMVKREGLRAWMRFRDALHAGRMPAEEVVNGALLLIAGAFLLTPGFLTDAVGLLLLLPVTRGLLNRAVRTRVRRSLGLGPATRPSRASRDDDALDVEVVKVERSDPADEDPPPELP